MMAGGGYGGYSGYGGQGGGGAGGGGASNGYGGGNYGGYGGFGGSGYGGAGNENLGGGGTGPGGGGFFSPGGFSGSQGDSPGGGRARRGGGGNQSLRPVTIKQLLDAKQSVPDAPHSLDGQELSQITFIGRINSINQQSTHISYVLDDGTSTMEVKKWLDQYDNDFEAERRDAFNEGSYVRVTGHLRSFHNKKSMVAFHIRAVESADEIAHHNLEAIFVHLYLTKGPLRSGDQQQFGNPELNPMQAAAFNQSAYAPNQGIYNPQVGHMGGDEFTPLQSNIMGFVRQFSHTGDGAAIPDIVHRLRSVGSEQEIRHAIQWLSAEGHLYSTMDDEHVKTTGD